MPRDPWLELPEAAWQEQVISLARQFHWRVAHFRAGRTSRGQWRTPVQADGAGFPDLMLCDRRIIYAELKADKGKITPDQVEWLAAIRSAGGEAYLWRPADLEDVVRVLSDGRARVAS